MILYPHAKINLTLSVTGHRTDGYHTLDTVFWPVSLCDRLSVEKNDTGLSFSCSDKALDTADNLACRAFRLMQERFGFAGGLTLQLEKRIPYQAGLGGGSSDAAAVMAACNRLFALELPRETLIGLGAQLGADVPCFFIDGPSRGKGTGTELYEIPTALQLPLLIVKPPEACSTPQMYRRLDEAGLQEDPAASDAAEIALRNHDHRNTVAAAVNDFDRVMTEKGVQKVRSLLAGSGAEKVILCGSGSAVCGIFAGEAEQNRALWQLQAALPADCRLLACHTLSASEGESLFDYEG